MHIYKDGTVSINEQCIKIGLEINKNFTAKLLLLLQSFALHNS